MSDELSKLNLKDDFEEAMSVSDATRWALEMPGDLEVLATMSPASAPNERFQARLLWAKYSDEPPSLKFRDPATGRLDLPQAWPIARGFRPQSLDACVNWCLEGFILHPEWKADPRFRWNPNGNPLLWVLRQLQEELDDHYQGRFK
ncbi:MAG: hypothetical protein LAO08_00200 [Acidobacteriia bacterium]|nr:hypothetical protein [Terriglobia bacterium]